MPCEITIIFPYEPFVPENVTVPAAAATIGVPFDVAISRPVCAELLIELDTPNLDVIMPETGLIKDIPKFAFPPDVLVEVFTFPVDLYFVLVLFEPLAVTTCFFGGSAYNFAIASSVVVKSFVSVSYFSTIDKLFMFVLFFP